MGLMVSNGLVEAWDGVTHKYLDPDKVAQARQAEMAYFEQLGCTLGCTETRSRNVVGR